MERRDLLEVLLEDARRSTEDLARMLGVAEDEVEAAIEELEADGVLAGYQAIVDWEETDADRVVAEVELNVELDRETGYEEIAQRLARFSEVTGLRLVSGEFDFLLTVEGESMRDVSRFVSDQVAPVPAITRTVTHFVMTTYKEGGVRFDDHDDDDRLSVQP